MSAPTIRETCSCGATFETFAYSATAGVQAQEWRKAHKHAESVGICGHELSPFSKDVPALFCHLKHGHTGMHSGGTSHWGQRVGEPREEPSP